MYRLLTTKTTKIAAGIIAIIAVVSSVAAMVSLPSLPPERTAVYVGRQSCISCHQQEAEAFAGSDHDCAMQEVNDQTVLGDFNDELLEESGQTARFFKRDGNFFVETQGDDGQLSVMKIDWTFGVQPIQQYMVALPNDANSAATAEPEFLGRVQVLRWSWDTEKKRWFHIDPPDVTETLAADDELHWTKPAQRWNNMCAECHSTNLKKNFDVDSASYHTTFSEIDVSCESCHGPGSLHIEIANRWFYRRDPKFGHGLANLKESAENQIQSCAPCHSRRGMLDENFHAGERYDDHFVESLLREGTYFNDGQVLDEDYVHGSFIQSKMYHKGIRCSDCHDPHSAKLKHTGNEVCTSCHQHPNYKYDTPSHHFHKTGQAGAFCVDCHMPATTYMEIDSRRDHSFRIPRPDLSVTLGIPNACTGCHINKESISSDKRDSLTQYLDWMNAARAGDSEIQAELQRLDQWSNDACNRWYGKERKTPYHFATALNASRNGDPDAVSKLRELLEKNGPEAPAIARATGLEDMSRIAPKSAAIQAIAERKDASPLVRAAAAAAAMGEPDPQKRFGIIKPLLEDQSRNVRVEAARTAATTLPAVQAFRDPAAQLALSELKTSMQFNNDRSAGNFGLGILEQQLGNDRAAIKHYEDAIRVEPSMTGPRTNLAAMLESLAQASSENAKLADSLLARAKTLRQEELPLMERDFGYAPTNASIAQRLGLAYYLSGDLEKAVERIASASRLEPASTEYALAYILILQKLGRVEEAIREADRILESAPDDAMLIQLRQELSAAH